MAMDLSSAERNSILQECRQCGTCCKKYRRIRLQPDEVEFIKKMGGHVGVDISLNELRSKSLAELIDGAKQKGRIYMIHPDDKGCVFLQKKNGKYFCRIYNYRPRACRGFRCNLADSSMLDLLSQDAMLLLNTEGLHSLR